MNLNYFDDSRNSVMKERNYDYFPKSETADSHDEFSAFPNKTPLAMAYVPYQQWGGTFSPDKALEYGTLFKDLVFKFEGGCGK